MNLRVIGRIFIVHILVTGGAGFIGSHLCKSLIEKGNNVICLDNYLTGSKENISHLKDSKNFKVLEHDIINPITLEIDQIYNLACPASPVYYQNDPIRTIHTNVIGITNMLELAKLKKARILQASTSEIYGDPEVHPQTENYWGNVNPIGIRSCYDEGKRVAESLMLDYHRQYQVDIKIVRIFNTYGPKMSPTDGRVVSNFIMQTLLNQEITVYGEGRQTRSFCYVSDLVEGLQSMMNIENFQGPVNLGNPTEYTILNLAKKIIHLTGSKSKIGYKPLPVDDPNRRQPNISLAKQKLSWFPRVDIDEGLNKTIQYFSNLMVKEKMQK